MRIYQISTPIFALKNNSAQGNKLLSSKDKSYVDNPQIASFKAVNPEAKAALNRALKRAFQKGEEEAAKKKALETQTNHVDLDDKDNESLQFRLYCSGT